MYVAANLFVRVCSNVSYFNNIKVLTTKLLKQGCCQFLFSVLFPVNRHFALYKYVHGKHGACLIGCLCFSISTPFIQVDEFHFWIVSLFDLCGS